MAGTKEITCVNDLFFYSILILIIFKDLQSSIPSPPRWQSLLNNRIPATMHINSISCSSFSRLDIFT